MHLFRPFPAVNRRARFIRGLAPLLLALAVSDACAVELTIVGTAGVRAVAVVATTDAANVLRLSGGTGQNAIGAVTTVSGAPVVLAHSIVTGGAGYNDDQHGQRPGPGGDADSSAAAYGPGAADVVARAEAIAATGGPDFFHGSQFPGGTATAQADVSAVPDPSTWLMLLLGTGGMLLMARHRVRLAGRYSAFPLFLKGK